MDRKLSQIVAATREAADGLDPAAAAADMIADAPAAIVKHMAALWLADKVRDDQRAETLQVERKAMRAEIMQEISAKGWRPRPRTRIAREWETDTPEGRKFVADRAEADARAASKLTSELRGIIDSYAEEIEVQWTAELLGSTFALPDGTAVAWGDATVAQHQTRQAMFALNASANIEGAARHGKAIEALTASGVDTLREMIGVPA